MKAHKYWSIGAVITMFGTFYTGYRGLKEAHKYFAFGSLICMIMSVQVLADGRKEEVFARKEVLEQARIDQPYLTKLCSMLGYEKLYFSLKEEEGAEA